MRESDITVVVPTYNRSHLILRALSSVISLLSSKDEIVVVDDGFTDDTAAVLRALAGSIRYMRQDNKGAGWCRAQ